MVAWGAAVRGLVCKWSILSKQNGQWNKVKPIAESFDIPYGAPAQWKTCKLLFGLSQYNDNLLR